jgi:SAM-dependent methyltransferase
MGRFATTVAYYEHARPPYGGAFFAEVARRLAFHGDERLLDVGTGPGILAIGFARFCGEIFGVDPEPAMIEAARAAAARAGVALRLIEGRLEDLPGTIGAFDAVTIGRAIHWLDPQPARAALERLVAPQGKILVCRASSVKDGRNPWFETFIAIRRRFGGERAPYDHRAFFAAGRFKLQETIAVERADAVPLERFADRLLSLSTSSPERLGDRIPEMRAAMREALAPFAKDGVIAEIVEARAEVFAATR